MSEMGMRKKSKLCGVPSLTLSLCDLSRGHEGDMHVSEEDGFYARCGLCQKPLASCDWYEPEDDDTMGYVCGVCSE